MERASHTPAAIAAVAALLAATALSGPTTPMARRSERPSELTQTIHGAEGGLLAVCTPTKEALVTVDQAARRLMVSRLERPSPEGRWSGQQQQFAPSFWPTDVQTERSADTCEIVSLVVAGIHDDCSATLERWKFRFGASGKSDATWIVRDPDNDGVFDAPVANASPQMRALRYDMVAS